MESPKNTTIYCIMYTLRVLRVVVIILTIIIIIINNNNDTPPFTTKVYSSFEGGVTVFLEAVSQLHECPKMIKGTKVSF